MKNSPFTERYFEGHAGPVCGEELFQLLPGDRFDQVALGAEGKRGPEPRRPGCSDPLRHHDGDFQVAVVVGQPLQHVQSR